MWKPFIIITLEELWKFVNKINQLQYISPKKQMEKIVKYPTIKISIIGVYRPKIRQLS